MRHPHDRNVSRVRKARIARCGLLSQKGAPCIRASRSPWSNERARTSGRARTRAAGTSHASNREPVGRDTTLATASTSALGGRPPIHRGDASPAGRMGARRTPLNAPLHHGSLQMRWRSALWEPRVVRIGHRRKQRPSQVGCRKGTLPAQETPPVVGLECPKECSGQGGRTRWCRYRILGR